MIWAARTKVGEVLSLGQRAARSRIKLRDLQFHPPCPGKGPPSGARPPTALHAMDGGGSCPQDGLDGTEVPASGKGAAAARPPDNLHLRSTNVNTHRLCRPTTSPPSIIPSIIRSRHQHPPPPAAPAPILAAAHARTRNGRTGPRSMQSTGDANTTARVRRRRR